ncbi:MAG: hypothetical protein IJ056_05040 [Acidaminococcaceae bacterium]|nr:hypothetical protein [Acidaminococcaceae bacterium]MBQ9634671.1 hypothetical protein [Acidaminococcaceae bacterium]
MNEELIIEFQKAYAEKLRIHENRAMQDDLLYKKAVRKKNNAELKRAWARFLRKQSKKKADRK